MSLFYCYTCNSLYMSKEDMHEIEVQGPSLLGNNTEKPCKFGLCKKCAKLLKKKEDHK